MPEKVGLSLDEMLATWQANFREEDVVDDAGTGGVIGQAVAAVMHVIEANNERIRQDVERLLSR